MNTRSMTAALVLMIVPAMLPGQTPNGSTGTAIERMPEALETRWALSALPPALRDEATVLVLDPATGYRTARQGTNGLTCFVERTAWELVDFRNDIYIPLCYDPAGAKTLLKVKMDVAVLRAQGMRADALKAEVERRYRTNTYRAPERPGVSYMTSPVFRTVGPPDMQVHTMAMPHLMFYAPFVTNEDIAAAVRNAVGRPASSWFVASSAARPYIGVITGQIPQRPDQWRISAPVSSSRFPATIRSSVSSAAAACPRCSSPTNNAWDARSS